MSLSRILGYAAVCLLTACMQASVVHGGAVSTASAATNEAPLVQEQSSTEPDQETGEGEESFKRHTVSLLTRAVTEDRADGGPAIGLDYEYRFHEEWGVGAFAEVVFGDLDTAVFGAMVNFHPTERLLIGVGPGLDTNKDETRALMRLGGLYEFEAGEDFVVAPAIFWDWIEEGHRAFLFGLNFGIKF